LLSIAKNNHEGRKLTGRGSADVLTTTRSYAAIGIGLVAYRNDVPDAVINELISMASGNHSPRDLQSSAAVALQLQSRSSSIPSMIALLVDQDQDDSMRAHVAVALAKLGAKNSLSTLKRSLSDPSALVAYSSAISLGLITDVDDDDTVNALIQKATETGDLAARSFALMALAEIGGPLAREHILETLTKGKSIEDRSFAALAAGVTGALHDQELSRLGRMVLAQYDTEKNMDVKSAMLIALGLLRYDPARVALRNALKEESKPELQGYAAVALGLLRDDSAIPVIRELAAQRKDVTLRERSGLALALLADREAPVNMARAALDSGSSKSFLNATLLGLGFAGDGSTVSFLREYLENNRHSASDATRVAAVTALGMLSDKDAIPLLARIRESSNYLAQTGALTELFSVN
jgi:HEAT repeat protein